MTSTVLKKHQCQKLAMDTPSVRYTIIHKEANILIPGFIITVYKMVEIGLQVQR